MRKFDDSAQLLLLAAFAIGFTLVITTIMLNNVIYASNMASESTSDISNYEISNIAQMTDEATRAAYNNNKNYTETVRDARIATYMDSYANEISTIYAFRGLSLSFDDSNLTEAYFTENGLYSGNSDWDVVKNVNRTDIFSITLTNTSKLGNASNAYEVQAINQSGSEIWFMKIYNDSSNINVSIYGHTHSLTQTGSPIYLNITGNKIDTVSVPPLFNYSTSTTNEIYNIKFVNSSNIMGYYLISGGLADGSTFVEERYKVTNATINVASSNNKINVSIPFTIP